MVISGVFMESLFYTLQTGLLANIDTSIENIWFVEVMLAEMVFTLIMSRGVENSKELLNCFTSFNAMVP